MRKEPIVFLTHILESINLIEIYLQGVTEEYFHVSVEKQDLVVRRLEIIGEATKNLPNEFQEEALGNSVEENGRFERCYHS